MTRFRCTPVYTLGYQIGLIDLSHVIAQNKLLTHLTFLLCQTCITCLQRESDYGKTNDSIYMESSNDYEGCEGDDDSVKAMKSDLRRLRQEDNF